MKFADTHGLVRQLSWKQTSGESKAGLCCREHHGPLASGHASVYTPTAQSYDTPLTEIQKQSCVYRYLC